MAKAKRKGMAGLHMGAKLLLTVALVIAGAHLTGLLPGSERTLAAVAPTPHAAPRPPRQPSPAPAPVIADANFVVKRVLRIEGPFRHGDYVWNDEGIPAGPVVVTIDLAAQTLSVFRGGYEIGAAVILYGADEKPTPLGVFPITEKDADHISNIFDVPMPYMLRLTNDGITIHGADVAWDAATNGCIGVPVDFAAKLFEAVKLGDRVIITRGERLSVGDPITAA